MSATDTTTQAAPATQEAAATAAPVEETTKRPELTDDQKLWLENMLETAGPAAIFQYVSDGTNDRAQKALTAGNRKGVLFEMTLGEVSSKAAIRIKKADERATRKRGKKAADGAADDTDDDDDDDDI